MKDIFLFDLDGTLTDSQEGILNCVQYALNDQGINWPDRSTLRPFIGPPLIESFQAICGMDYSHAEQAVRKYRERYSEVGLFENRVYEGILELLNAVKRAGKQCIMATSKPEEYSHRIAERFGLSAYLDDICGATLDGRINSKESVIRLALERAGQPDPSRVHMIGDRKHDVLGARACGIDCTYVLFGFGSREEAEQCEAAYIVETVEELKQHLLQL
ncbi:MAG: HAD hydrolase-like protein [Butyricicoccus sp.]